MRQKDATVISDLIKEILEENPRLFSMMKEGWYEKREYFLKENQKMISLLIEKGRGKLTDSFSQDELFAMQKLYLMYPKAPPKKLMSLAWENVKLILPLCDLEKRKFYTDISYYLELDAKTLQKYILNDLYEKVLFLISEIQDYHVVNEEQFLNKVIEIQDMVFET